MPKKPNQTSKVGVKTYISMSAIAGVAVGVIVWGAMRDFEKVFIWAGLTFIISLVATATLALSVKDDASDPDKPRLK